MRIFLVSLGLLALAGPVLATDTAPRRTTPFPDVPRNHWAFSAVEELRERGIVRGYPPGEFTTPIEQRRASSIPVASPITSRSVSQMPILRPKDRQAPPLTLRRPGRQR